MYKIIANNLSRYVTLEVSNHILVYNHKRKKWDNLPGASRGGDWRQRWTEKTNRGYFYLYPERSIIHRENHLFSGMYKEG